MEDFKIFSLNKFRKIKNNYYEDKNECLKHSKEWKQTNPRFKTFDQTHFHAGDMNDINKYGLLPLRYVYSNENKEIDIKKEGTEEVFKLYKNIDYNSVFNTFTYMFNKFKKGIFVIIRDNKLLLFLPFSNAYYKNNWYKKTYFSMEEKKLLETEDYNKIKPKLDQSIIEFQKKYPDQFRKYKINLDRKKWQANNCFFRNQYPIYEGELTNNVYKNMLEELLKNRKIPNVEFFINNRDFPILKIDYTEPYEHLFDANNVKIEKEYQFKKMAPIFSKSITDKFADILMPTNDDWLMASNKFYTADCSNSYRKNQIEKWNYDWSKKKNICIFRGGATGCGITIDNNMRLKAASISINYPDILDAGITDWNAKPKKYTGCPVEVIDSTNFRFKLANKINNIEKSNYKYILNIDGHVSAFRLSSELSMNSVVLLVTSPYKLWFSNMLVPFIHYIPIKSNLEDLIDTINWCIDNDSKCKDIASNAKLFFDKYLTKDGIFNYLEDMLGKIYSNKNFKNLLDVKFTKKNIAYISCFRDKGDGKRDKQRKIFVQLMSKILKPYCNFHIYIIEQSEDNELFNIGKLKNIGYVISKSETKYDHYIFSDIDTIPDYDLMEYIIKKGDKPICLASRGTRYQSKNDKSGKPFLGALLSFSGTIFEKINGYPNNFWGWGGEDDAVINRLLYNKYKSVYYPKKGGIIDFEEGGNMSTIDVVTKFKNEKKDLIKYEKLYGDLELWKLNGINSLNYNIIDRHQINEYTTQIKVDLLKKRDEDKYPDWFPGPINNYISIQTSIKLKWKDIKIEYL
jgi:hypothetical protein